MGAPRRNATSLTPSTTSSARDAAHPAWIAWVALGTVYVVWGSTYLAIRVMVETVPALLGAGVRFVIAGAVLYAWLIAGRGAAAVRVSRREAAGAGLVGCLLIAGGNGLVTVAERHLASSLAALVVACVPLLIVLIRALTREQVGRPALVGVAVGFVGVAILVLPGAHAGASGLGGVLIVLAASLSWAAGSVSSTRLTMPRDLLVSTALQMLAGGAAMLLGGALSGEHAHLAGLSTRSLLAFAYLIVVGSLAAFTAYTWLLQHVPISRVSTYAYVNPVIAVALGWSLLGESIAGTTLLGAAIIIGAVWFIVRSTRPRPRIAADCGDAAAAGAPPQV